MASAAESDTASNQNSEESSRHKESWRHASAQKTSWVPLTSLMMGGRNLSCVCEALKCSSKHQGGFLSFRQPHILFMISWTCNSLHIGICTLVPNTLLDPWKEGNLFSARRHNRNRGCRHRVKTDNVSHHQYNNLQQQGDLSSVQINIFQVQFHNNNNKSGWTGGS